MTGIFSRKGARDDTPPKIINEFLSTAALRRGAGGLALSKPIVLSGSEEPDSTSHSVKDENRSWDLRTKLTYSQGFVLFKVKSDYKKRRVSYSVMPRV